jgi:hypothetical protein
MKHNTKAAVIEMIRKLPDDATLADIVDHLRFRQQVDEGLRQLDNGDAIEHEEVARRLSKWL